MKAVSEPDAGIPPVRFDEEVLGNSRALLYNRRAYKQVQESGTAWIKSVFAASTEYIKTL
jgi:hypothetical protein